MDSESKLLEAIERQTESLRRLTRPHIITDVFPRHFVNALYFRIRNVGNTSAYGIRVTITPPINFRNHISSELGIFRSPIPALGPREEIVFFLNSAVELFNQKDAILAFKTLVNYTDVEQHQYEETFPIDIELLKGLALEMPIGDRILDELSDLRREIEKIARYAETLKDKEMYQQYEKSKKQTRKTKAVQDKSK
jgi:hypothetical protein